VFRRHLKGRTSHRVVSIKKRGSLTPQGFPTELVTVWYVRAREEPRASWATSTTSPSVATVMGAAPRPDVHDVGRRDHPDHGALVPIQRGAAPCLGRTLLLQHRIRGAFPLTRVYNRSVDCWNTRTNRAGVCLPRPCPYSGFLLSQRAVGPSSGRRGRALPGTARSSLDRVVAPPRQGRGQLRPRYTPLPR